MDSNRSVCVCVFCWVMKTTFDHMFYLPVPQLEDILKMGFQNKFYNASKKVSGPGSTQAVEYRVNMSSDTPHWYVRDYMARVSNHYGINSISVDGENRFIGCSSEALGSRLHTSTSLSPDISSCSVSGPNLQMWTSVRAWRPSVSLQPSVLTPTEATGVCVMVPTWTRARAVC